MLNKKETVEMSLDNVSVVGGQINYPSLTSKLPAMEYAKAKVHMWLYMLNEGKNPVKWLKPNNKGTKVNFEMMKSQTDYDKGIIDLEEYIDQVNAEFDLDFKLNR